MGTFHDRHVWDISYLKRGTYVKAEGCPMLRANAEEAMKFYENCGLRAYCTHHITGRHLKDSPKHSTYVKKADRPTAEKGTL